ncbi:hypothetical protein Ocin01_00627 [Orchesella cincta]|uniref:Paramyosin n=1 Tax=Orchesella cincta TaxID=48709 RepID=A0A1D2NLS2_ORCCI|nr:hypothetical protein Ocin01_00627 [Orchesella cincta]
MGSFFQTGGFILLIFAALVYAAPQAQRGSSSGDYSVTHLDIRDAILSLVSVLRDQMDKLERHEVRERQLGEQLTRSLASLEKRTRGEEKNIENIATYIARIEEKLKVTQTSIDKQSEDHRAENHRIRSDLDILKQLLNEGGSTAAALAALDTKITSLNEKLSLLKDAGDRTTEKFDGLMELWKATSHGSAGSSGGGGGGSDLSDAIMSELADIKESLSRTQEIETQILTLRSPGGEHGSDWQTEVIESIDSQRKQLAVLEEEIGKAVGMLGDMTTSAQALTGILTNLDTDTRKGFEVLDLQVSDLRQNSTGDLERKLGKMQEILKSGQKHLEERVRMAEKAVDGLFVKMESEYDHLSSELKGLANVESVLLDTGDSVLDTKRRLEYGVQQIMGEMNHQLTTHTASLNASLQARFDGLSDAVLGNQSIALMNLTGRMEEEISQVWRQIGILYHQMSRSANLLDEIHNQTSKYVNNSLDTMSSMDDKVGQVTNRMGEVDDNLNYLLGRMSLVVQEFNQIKSGLGDALTSLRDSFTEISEFEKKPDPLETNKTEDE